MGDNPWVACPVISLVLFIGPGQDNPSTECFTGDVTLLSEKTPICVHIVAETGEQTESQ